MYEQIRRPTPVGPWGNSPTDYCTFRLNRLNIFDYYDDPATNFAVADGFGQIFEAPAEFPPIRVIRTSIPKGTAYCIQHTDPKGELLYMTIRLKLSRGTQADCIEKVVAYMVKLKRQSEQQAYAPLIRQLALL